MKTCTYSLYKICGLVFFLFFKLEASTSFYVTEHVKLSNICQNST